jgi:hypothetical protein
VVVIPPEAEAELKVEVEDELKEEPADEFDFEPEDEEGQEPEEEEDEEEEDYAKEEEDKSKKKKSTKKAKSRKESGSSRKGRCDNVVELIVEALKGMGGRATGIDITDWLSKHYPDLGGDRKKLGYMVNAVLSSKKYKGKFVKEKMVNGGQRALWKLVGSSKGGKGKSL